MGLRDRSFPLALWGLGTYHTVYQGVCLVIMEVNAIFLLLFANTCRSCLWEHHHLYSGHRCWGNETWHSQTLCLHDTICCWALEGQAGKPGKLVPSCAWRPRVATWYPQPIQQTSSRPKPWWWECGCSRISTGKGSRTNPRSKKAQAKTISGASFAIFHRCGTNLFIVLTQLKGQLPGPSWVNYFVSLPYIFLFLLNRQENIK